MVEELPDFQPRFIVYSFVHAFPDGRVNYPMVFIFYCPHGSKPEHNMIYTGSRHTLQQAIEVTKVGAGGCIASMTSSHHTTYRQIFEIRNKEELDQAWLDQQCGFSK